MCDWIAAATSYSTHGVPMIPFYIFYSMFGFQRVGDLAWAAGDMRSRGFLLGGTAGRTTLNGEGLQHEDGHSHLMSATIPNCISYDPTFGYEVAVIIQDGLRRMYAEQEDVYYYLTVMNENYRQPAMPEGAAPAIIKGMYLFRAGEKKAKAPRVQLLGSGTIFREVIAAAALLQERLGRRRPTSGAARASPSSRATACAVARENLLQPDGEAEASRTSRAASTDTPGPVIAATDYVRAFAEQIRAFVPRRYVVLGTDGFGRSDTREKLRRFFEVDRHYVTVAALKALADEGALPAAKVAEAMQEVRARPGEAGAVDRLTVRARTTMSTIEVKVPDIGDFTDVPVIEIFVKPGDTVKAEDSLVTLESDKATMDVPSPAAGIVKEVKVKVGDKVSEGSLIVVLEAAAAPRARARPSRRQRRRPPPAAAAAAAPRRGARRRARGARSAGAERAAPPPRRPSTAQRSRPRTRRRRCASSRASSASISRASRAPARRAASCRRTCRTSSSRR